MNDANIFYGISITLLKDLPITYQNVEKTFLTLEKINAANNNFIFFYSIFKFLKKDCYISKEYCEYFLQHFHYMWQIKL